MHENKTQKKKEGKIYHESIKIKTKQTIQNNLMAADLFGLFIGTPTRFEQLFGVAITKRESNYIQIELTFVVASLRNVFFARHILRLFSLVSLESG